jgi:phosphatidylserine synthase
MRTLMLITIGMELLAVIAAVVCSLFGVSFFHFGPELHSRATAINEWLVTIWMLFMLCLVIVTTRLARFRRAAALLFYWSVSIIPLLLAFVFFLESCITNDTAFARYHRMECLVILLFGLFFETLAYYGFHKRKRNA